jgi:hypothetical protein
LNLLGGESETNQVENARLVSSYAVSPQTYFAAPPCSIYQKINKEHPARRFTYAATKNTRTELKTQLLCLEEKIQQADPKNLKRTHHLLESSSPVASIQALPSYDVTKQEQGGHDVLVLQQDGTANCFSAGLQQSIWATQLGELIQLASGQTSTEAEAFSVEYAEVTDVGTARNGLLRGRDDILALLQSADAAAGAADAIQILFVVSSSEHGRLASRKTHTFALRPRTSSSDPALRSIPQHLISWPLPPTNLEALSTNGAIYSLHASSGSLELLQDGSITSYDFSGLSPRVSSVLKSPEGAVTSFVRLSSSLILTTSSQQYTIFDVKYNSIQASRILDVQGAPKKKKRKSLHYETHPAIPNFIGYFSKAGVAVALSGQDLVGLRVSGDAPGSKRRKIKDTMLIDSIGKGITTVTPLQKRDEMAGRPNCLGAFVVGSAVKADEKKWSAKMEELDHLLEIPDIPAFEHNFAKSVYMDTNYDRFLNNPKRKRSVEFEWKFPTMQSNYPLPLYREQALYALGRIFQFEQPSGDDLSRLLEGESRQCPISIKLFAPNILQWLIVTGQLTAPLIQQALEASSQTAQTVSHGDMIAAIAEFDPSLTLLHIVLDRHVRLDVEEVGQAVKIILQSLDEATLPQPDRKLVADANPEGNELALIESRLTNGDTHLTNGNAVLTNGHIHHDSPEAEIEIDAAMDAAIQDLDEDIDCAIEALETGPINGDSLRQALTRLNNFPSSAIVQTLRKYLSQHEIALLITILRVELQRGGWTARYIDVGPDDSGEPSNRAISVIASIISCAVDALGISGWLTTNDDSVDDLLQDLRAEISATLEGVHEATFLTGILGEFLRFPYKRQKAGWKETPANARSHILQQGKVWTVPKKEDPVLPLGLSVRKRLVDSVSVDHGGVLHFRDRREMGKLIHEMRGIYQFEQIRI